MKHFVALLFPVLFLLASCRGAGGASASLPEGVSAIEGAGSYRKGEEAELGISLREGYRFEGWYLLDGNGEERLSDQESCIFTVEGTVRIEARVAKNQ